MDSIPESRREHLAQFAKYAVVGGFATAVNLVTFFLCAYSIFPALTADDKIVILLSRFVELHVGEMTDAVRSVNALYCNIVAFAVSNVVCYIMNRLFVFKPGRHSIAVEFLLFTLVSGTSSSVGAAGQTALIACLGLSTSFALAANIVAALAINYAMRKFVIFKG